MWRTQLLLLVTLALGERDEVHLLQSSRHSFQDNELGKQDLSDLPNWSQIAQAATHIAEDGLSKVTVHIFENFKKVNATILSAERAFNNSLKKFQAGEGSNFSASENLTHFQAFMSEVGDDLLPVYEKASKSMRALLAAATNLLSSLGQQDLKDKIEEWVHTATGGLQDLQETTETMTRDMAGATDAQFADYHVTLSGKVEYLQQVVADLRGALRGSMEDFTGRLAEPLRMTLGESEVNDKIESLARTSDDLLASLERLIVHVCDALSEAANNVQYALQSHEGFFSPLFKIFR